METLEQFAPQFQAATSREERLIYILEVCAAVLAS